MLSRVFLRGHERDMPPQWLFALFSLFWANLNPLFSLERAMTMKV